MVELAFFFTSQMHHSQSQQRENFLTALEDEDDRKVVFLCNRSMMESNPPLLSDQVKKLDILSFVGKEILLFLCFLGVLLEAEDDRKVLVSSLASEGIIEDEEMDNDVVVNASVEKLFPAK